MRKEEAMKRRPWYRRRPLLLGGVAAVAVGLVLTLSSGTAAQEATGRINKIQREYFARADIVFVGRVVGLGKRPRFRSGVVLARQAAIYSVDRVIKGSFSLPEIVVHHIVVGPPTAHPNPKIPALNPKLFKPGRRVIVAAKFKRWTQFGPKDFPYLFVDDEERFGPVAFDPKLIEVVRSLPKGKASK